MPLLNYTTTVSPAKTASEITLMLAKAGAVAITTEYREEELVGLSFAIETADGLRAFKLPVRTEPILAILRKQRVTARYSTPAQAERVGWRIAKDWLEAQLALVATEMVTLDQIMLPYMYARGGTTFYELYRDGGLPQLGVGD